MSKYIWHDCKKQPPLVDDGELVLMDSNDRFWVGFCKITSNGVFYFANNAEPLKNDFVKYARIEKLLELETELERTRKALETLQVFITKLYLSGKITDEQLERYKKMLISALEQK